MKTIFNALIESAEQLAINENISPEESLEVIRRITFSFNKILNKKGKDLLYNIIKDSDYSYLLELEDISLQNKILYKSCKYIFHSLLNYIKIHVSNNIEQNERFKIELIKLMTNLTKRGKEIFSNIFFEFFFEYLSI